MHTAAVSISPVQLTAHDILLQPFLVLPECRAILFRRRPLDAMALRVLLRRLLRLVPGDFDPIDLLKQFEDPRFEIILVAGAIRNGGVARAIPGAVAWPHLSFRNIRFTAKRAALTSFCASEAKLVAVLIIRIQSNVLQESAQLFRCAQLLLLLLVEEPLPFLLILPVRKPNIQAAFIQLARSSGVAVSGVLLVYFSRRVQACVALQLPQFLLDIEMVAVQ